ncbi:hypothetical protein ACP4OV_001266 [Aristida adscensionis]
MPTPVVAAQQCLSLAAAAILVLAILDDPLVSRVFADAGFRSGDIKLAILRPAPPMPLLSRLPARASSPHLHHEHRLHHEQTTLT